MVVIEVMSMALNLCLLAVFAAVAPSSPSAILSFIKVTSKMESLTTIPAKDTNPMMLGMESSSPIKRCPQITPVKDNGIAMRITSDSM